MNCEHIILTYLGQWNWKWLGVVDIFCYRDLVCVPFSQIRTKATREYDKLKNISNLNSSGPKKIDKQNHFKTTKQKSPDEIPVCVSECWLPNWWDASLFSVLNLQKKINFPSFSFYKSSRLRGFIALFTFPFTGYSAIPFEYNFIRFLFVWFLLLYFFFLHFYCTRESTLLLFWLIKWQLL